VILNTTANQYAGNGISSSYAPFDPKYLYPERQLTSQAYPNGYLAHESPGGNSALEDWTVKREIVIDSRIKLVLSDIEQRRLMKEDNLYHIDLDQCACRNLIFERGDFLDDGKKLELERRIIDLERDKRMEQVSYFRDILFLKKELRETMIERLEESQKTELLFNQEA
jgi:hypothetical protein